MADQFFRRADESQSKRRGFDGWQLLGLQASNEEYVD